ncbi:storkhead-box protein 1 [Rhynochetos jubatus]
MFLTHLSRYVNGLEPEDTKILQLLTQWKMMASPRCDRYVLQKGILGFPVSRIKLAFAYVLLWVVILKGPSLNGDMGFEAFGAVQAQRKACDGFCTCEEYPSNIAEQTGCRDFFLSAYCWTEQQLKRRKGLFLILPDKVYAVIVFSYGQTSEQGQRYRLPPGEMLLREIQTLRGFICDVTPVLTNPLWQTHPISVSEGICRTVSDMDATHGMVTQEALMEQLVTNYPGIAVPSHDILYNILGPLIKERKTYRTGEGYFMVTPNTYFTTNGATEDNSRVPLGDSSCCSLPSVAYLVNVECCAEPGRENIPTVSRYRTCPCFPDQNMLCEQRHQVRNRESNGGGKKGSSELKPSVPAPETSTSAENHSRDTIKSLTSVKRKKKRFGLGLFWRSASKKEKPKKEYSTFSAQFPPKEWPVRDEDDLDNIPRDIEHEIIKSINPTLTVDNLIKHTILMQELEEQKKGVGKDTSAEVSAVRQNRRSQDCVQKTQRKPAKRTRKTKSKQEKQVSRSNTTSHIHEPTSQDEKREGNLSLPLRNQQPSDVAVESDVIYKKQIKNPFQGLPWRRNFCVKGYRGTVNGQLKSRTRKPGRAFQRPRSLDCPNPFDCETEQPATETQADEAKQRKLPRADGSSLQPKKGSLSENFSYPQGSALQIDDNKSKYFLESNTSEENIYRTVQKNHGDMKTPPHFYTEDSGMCKEEANFSLHLKGGHCKADTVCELLDQTANEFQNVSLSNYTASVNVVKKPGVKYRQKTDKKSEVIFKYDCASHPGSMRLGSVGFTDNWQLLHQKAHDGDTCNSLHLDDTEPRHLPPGHAFSDTRVWSKAVQKLGAAASLKTWKVNVYPIPYDTTANKGDSGEHGCRERASFAESIDGSKAHPNPDFTGESCLCSQVLLIGHRKEEETGLIEGTKVPAEVDFWHANEAGSDPDAVQNFTYETGEAAAHCAFGSQTKERSSPREKKGLIFKNTRTVISGQKHSEGTENHSITGDSGIDSPRWTEKKMKLPAKF